MRTSRVARKTKRVKSEYGNMEEMVQLSPDEYANLLNENTNLKAQVEDLKELIDFKKTGIPSDKLLRSIRYKVSRFVFRVQANNPADEVVKMIDRATNDIVRFISNLKMADNKNTMNDGIFFVDEE